MAKNELSRRDFFKVVTVAIGGFITALTGIPSLVYLVSPAVSSKDQAGTIDLGPLENYPTGLPTRFDFTQTKVNGWERTAVNYGMYVVRSDDQVRVFSDICTHLGCKVTWHPDSENYVSPCHDGHFDKLGNVVSGPPPRPLDEYLTRIVDGRLIVTLPPYKRAG
jgi:Rieske Fe-S protein